MSLKLPTVKVRVRVVVGGAVLGGALLVGMALVGGVDSSSRDPREPAPDRLGPATAIQPELNEALLTDQDLPSSAPPADRGSPRAVRPGEGSEPAGDAPPPPAAREPRPETGALGSLCRALFENPDGLAGLWRTSPEEITSRHTSRPGGAVLHQLLGVFDAERSVEAFRQLRESASGCQRFETSLAGRDPVTILLEELTARQPEASPADESYTLIFTLENGDPAGWLTVDRIGRVVSVLRYVGPADADADVTQTRQAALHKLQPLLRALQKAAG